MELLARSTALGGRLWRRHRRELGAFGAVGALAFVVDVGLFNLLRFGGDGLLADKPLTAKVISACVATVFAWAGNRWWTFRHRNRPAVLRELALFGAMNGLALLIGLLVLATSHYALGLRGPVADNAANLVGIGLGTAFRYVAYRLWVFRSADRRSPAVDPPVSPPVNPPSAGTPRTSPAAPAAAPDDLPPPRRGRAPGPAPAPSAPRR